ncbi:MerR family transcriptional regulator [Streptomyces mirabilis]|uniref:MerR family transcriptional regulator n=1 Tax=Streptomyces mirabilis TaxID=68239 RepID=UPI00371C0BFF
MKISEVARQAGVTVKTIRYYESVGVIAPGRLGNGYRDYSEQDARLVREARELTGLGIRVQRTRPFLDCLAAGRDRADDCPASLAGYRDAINELTARIEALTARRRVLQEHLRDAAYRNSPIKPREPLEFDQEGTIVSDLSILPANLPVPTDDGAADHLPGLPMPRLELPSTTGNAVGLDTLGAGRSVLYLYPMTGTLDTDLPDGWDNIPGARGCTPQACDFRDHHEELLAAGVSHVFGLSSQDSAYQQELVERLRLPFSVLSDTNLDLAARLDLPTFPARGAILYKRLTLVVRNGVIEHVFYPIFPPNEHAQQVLRWLLANPV